MKATDATKLVQLEAARWLPWLLRKVEKAAARGQHCFVHRCPAGVSAALSPTLERLGYKVEVCSVSRGCFYDREPGICISWSAT